MLQEQVMYNLIECNNSGVLDVATFTSETLAKYNLSKFVNLAIKEAQELGTYRSVSEEDNSYKIFYKNGEWLQYKVISCNLYSF